MQKAPAFELRGLFVEDQKIAAFGSSYIVMSYAM
jgi:hypothetical protein